MFSDSPLATHRICSLIYISYGITTTNVDDIICKFLVQTDFDYKADCNVKVEEISELHNIIINDFTKIIKDISVANITGSNNILELVGFLDGVKVFLYADNNGLDIYFDSTSDSNKIYTVNMLEYDGLPIEERMCKHQLIVN
jgi:hypothetical protein